MSQNGNHQCDKDKFTATKELLCDDVRQLVISFLGKPVDSIGMNINVMDAATFAVSSGEAMRLKNFPFLKSSVPPSRSFKATFPKNAFSTSSAGNSSLGEEEASSDALLSVQLISQSWNRSFHETSIDAGHVVVRRAIICRHRCLFFSLPSLSVTTTTTAGGSGCLPLVDEEDKDNNKLAIRDIAALAQEQLSFLATYAEEMQKIQEASIAWQAAAHALNTLKTEHLSEVKSLKRPPAVVLMTLEAVCILCNTTGTTWADARKLLASDIKSRLMNFDKDAVTSCTMEKIQKYIANPSFQPHLVRRASIAAEGLCAWVRALDQYHKIGQEVSADSKRIMTQFAIAREIVALAEMLQSSLSAASLRDQQSSSATMAEERS